MYPALVDDRVTKGCFLGFHENELPAWVKMYPHFNLPSHQSFARFRCSCQDHLVIATQSGAEQHGRQRHPEEPYWAVHHRDTQSFLQVFSPDEVQRSIQADYTLSTTFSACAQEQALVTILASGLLDAFTIGRCSWCLAGLDLVAQRTEAMLVWDDDGAFRTPRSTPAGGASRSWRVLRFRGKSASRNPGED